MENEPLQVDNEEVRKSPDGQRLGGTLMFPTDRTVPRIALIQHFLFRECRKAVIEIELVFHQRLVHGWVVFCL